MFGQALPSTQIVQMFIQLNQMGVTTSMILGKPAYLLVVGFFCFSLGYYRLCSRIK
ncbi:hypothetical protein Asch01_00924 [Acinetobacter schindleri]